MVNRNDSSRYMQGLAKEITVVHTEKDMQVMVITVVLLTQCFTYSQL